MSDIPLPIKISQEISGYIDSLPDQKRREVDELHQWVLAKWPEEKLWFLDGRNDKGKVVSNPNIGYGCYTIHYADGKTREFYKVGISANTAGISVYIMGIADKEYLKNTYADRMGKASITGYCIKFKSLKDIHLETLQEAIHHRLISGGH